jgi:hypothetical protein
MARQPLVGQGLLIVEASWSHSVGHAALGRNPLDEGSARRRDDTQHSQETDIHTTSGIRTHCTSREGDRQVLKSQFLINEEIANKMSS